MMTFGVSKYLMALGIFALASACNAETTAFPPSCLKLLKVVDQCSSDGIDFVRMKKFEAQVVQIETSRQAIYQSFLQRLKDDGYAAFSDACSGEDFKKAIRLPQIRVADAMDKVGGNSASCRRAIDTLK